MSKKDRVVDSRSSQDTVKLLNKPTAVNTDSGVVKKVSFFDKPPIPQQSSEIPIDTLLEKYGLRKRGNLTVFDKDVHTKGMLRQHRTWHAYGGFQDAATTITVGDTSTWYHITNAGNDLWTGLEGDGITISGDVMTFENTGDYVGSLSIDLSALTGKDYHIRIYNVTTSAQMGYYMGVSTTGAGNNVPISMPLYLEVSAGDQLKLEIECTTSATNVVVDNAVFYLAYLHD